MSLLPFPILLTLIALLVASACATCRTFIPSPNTSYFYYPTVQRQNVTAGFTCSSTGTVTPPTPYHGNCSFPADPTTNITTLGCFIGSDAYVTARGFTNLSLSDADAAGIFTLLNTTSPFNTTSQPGSGGGDWYAGRGFYASYAGCVQPQACVPYGSSGYLADTPLLKCYNGTLEDCEGGPVLSGTGISICGAMQVWDTPLIQWPNVNQTFESMTEAEVEAMVEKGGGVGGNETCKLLWSSAAGKGRGGGGRGVWVVVAVVVGLVLVVG